MASNVYEWCDGDATYRNSNVAVKIMRGGSYVDKNSDLRVADRYANPPDGKFFYAGFRCMLDVN